MRPKKDLGKDRASYFCFLNDQFLPILSLTDKCLFVCVNEVTEVQDIACLYFSRILIN